MVSSEPSFSDVQSGLLMLQAFASLGESGLSVKLFLCSSDGPSPSHGRSLAEVRVASGPVASQPNVTWQAVGAIRERVRVFSAGRFGPLGCDVASLLPTPILPLLKNQKVRQSSTNDFGRIQKIRTTLP